MRKSTLILPAVFIAVVGLLSSVFIVDEREKVLVLQFGRVVFVKTEPGLAFKIPLIQDVVRYDDRILSRDIPEREVTLKRGQRLRVNAFARYEIVDPVVFREAVGPTGIEGAQDQLDSIFIDELRKALGTITADEVLSVDRIALMQRISVAANAKTKSLGIRVIDVRLKKTDLPDETLNETYAEMVTERKRKSINEIARGKEAALRVTSLADRTAIELTSDARRKAEITRGQADAKRNAIFAEAYGKDIEFFEFYRSLAAYREALKGHNSTMVLSPDSEFFNYLKSAKPE